MQSHLQGYFTQFITTSNLCMTEFVEVENTKMGRNWKEKDSVSDKDIHHQAVSNDVPTVPGACT